MNREIISIDSKSIILTHSATILENSLKDFLEWISYELDLDNNLISQSDWKITVSDTSFGAFGSCLDWDESKIVTILSDHLSSFVPVFNISKQFSAR